MDHTQKYIEMCEKAFKDIGYIPPEGHFWNAVIIKPPPYKVPYTIVYDKTIESIETGCDPGRKVTGQLYRQDQLQKMIKKEKLLGDGSLYFLLKTFESFVNWKLNRRFFDNASMEQLWLIFVMKEEYNKIWSSKDWVK